ncbi:MAG: T9SS type A sorting domain-containing protein [Sphingobacteriales bacterium]|nr:MAG: T9SS type A sorting domain-containing protein [Sphingobacteriales bacterium]
MKQMIKTCAAAVLLCASLNTQAQQTKETKVLFIGIDGVRADALNQANTPTIDSLMSIGLYTYDSWHCGITVSGPSWNDMLCGVWEQKHKVTNNNYTNADYVNYPYFPKRAKECRPDLKAVQIITWDPMNDPSNSNNTAGYVTNSGFNQSIDAGSHGQHAVTNAALVQLADPNLDVLFIHYDEVDATGHGSGFNTTNPAYINAIQGVDAEVGEVLTALYARPNYANEDWLIMLTTDHGGIGTSHGGNSNTERHIWWVAAGQSIPHLEITGPDPGSYVMANNPLDTVALKNTPVLTDIAVTALAHLMKGKQCESPETNPVWNLDGKSWLLNDTIPDPTDTTEQPTYIEDVNNASIQFGIYPNPNYGAFKAAFKNLSGNININIANMTGAVVMHKEMKAEKGFTVIPFDLTSLPKGIYIMQVTNNGKRTTRKIVLR